MTNLMVLKCEHDGHSFSIPSRRGRPPKFCSEHQPTSADSASAERELYCEIGDHSYSAPKRRGKPPKNCPEHSTQKSPIKSVSVKTNVIREGSALVQQGKLLAQLQTHDKQRIHHIDNNPNNNEIDNLELQRELHCENGNHNYWAKVQRGKPPSNCNIHKPSLELTQKISEKKRQEREADKLKEQVINAESRVKDATILDDNAYQIYIKTKSEDTMNLWLKNNIRLLNEVNSLRAKENKLQLIRND